MTTAIAAAPLPDLADVPYARGYFDQFTPLDWQVNLGSWSLVRPPNRLFRSRGLLVTGWVLMPDGPFDKIAAYVNDQEFFTCIPGVRPDVAEAFPFVPNAGKCSFAFKVPASLGRRGHLAIVGRRDGRPAGKMLAEFRDDLPRIVPIPPAELTNRVVYTKKPHFFLAQGYKSFCEIRDALARHVPLNRVGRLLDWGCGCGRLTAHWLRVKNGPEIHGCDIDSQAIEWCRGNLRGGRFETVNFAPPTPYPDGHFGAIFGYSLFTHLTRDAQVAWLGEMHRILKPGGTFVATVHGPSAAYFHFGESAAGMLGEGIHDATVDGGLDFLLGQGVYRTTYQTPAWTRETFGQFFDVIEYTERAIGNIQDLVVLRKR